MRTIDCGSNYRVLVFPNDTRDFARRWPCFGPITSFAFEFSKANGDLVDLTGDTDEHDATGVRALSEDAQAYGKRALGLS